MSKYITREELASTLGLTVPVVSEAIAAKIIPVEERSGMVPRTWFNGAKLTGGKVYEELLLKTTRSSVIWATVLTVSGLAIGFGLGIS